MRYLFAWTVGCNSLHTQYRSSPLCSTNSGAWCAVTRWSPGERSITCAGQGPFISRPPCRRPPSSSGTPAMVPQDRQSQSPPWPCAPSWGFYVQYRRPGAWRWIWMALPMCRRAHISAIHFGSLWGNDSMIVSSLLLVILYLCFTNQLVFFF